MSTKTKSTPLTFPTTAIVDADNVFCEQCGECPHCQHYHDLRDALRQLRRDYRRLAKAARRICFDADQLELEAQQEGWTAVEISRNTIRKLREVIR